MTMAPMIDSPAVMCFDPYQICGTVNALVICHNTPNINLPGGPRYNQ